MSQPVDIEKVISTSTSSVSLDDLTRKGFKQVKVLNQNVITRLIAEAVDRVLDERSKEISREEREKVIKEARGQFETLAKKRIEEERSRVEDLERSNSSLIAELEVLRKRQALSVELQAERDKLFLLVQKAEKELAAARARLKDLEEQVARLVESLAAAEKNLSLMEGLLESKNQEIQRLQDQQASAGPMSEKILAAINARLAEAARPSEVDQIKLAIDGLSRRIANFSSGGGGFGEGGKDTEFRLDALLSDPSGATIESNVSKVKVKQARASGVKDALARLKKLQQGGEDGQ